MSDEKLWMLNIQGPDDVIAAPSKDEADKVAAAFNAHWGAYLAKQRAASIAEGKDPDNWPTVTAIVVEWDSTPAAHASSVKKYWPEYAQYLTPHP
ncbi:hypothetical protein [Paraburkholderia sp. Ac-20340]|uniref:hypothetical protein n=1 Tax=Paraburkholderia sp. Ac-20340 TaxID=2703888 RepID=UPI001F11B03D|nr:hypothetical protein [Paraburkholderia sp. Ac-20340]